jgi:hypothetical protein
MQRYGWVELSPITPTPAGMARALVNGMAIKEKNRRMTNIFLATITLPICQVIFG